MKSSCAQWNVPNNSDEEINLIKSSINSVAQSSSLDPRFILAIVMQESNGCVRVPTTSYSVTNPGLMQSHEGTGTCNDGTNVQNPCPASEILQMIKDGSEGTAAGAGLQQCLAQEGGSGPTAYYKAARCYNSGSVAPSGNLGQGVATHCYVSDITNRLLGWSSGASNCNAGTIGGLTGSSWSDSGSNSSPAPAPAPAPAPETSTPQSHPTADPVPAASATETQAPAPPPLATNTAAPVPTALPALPSTLPLPLPTSTPASSAVPLYPYAISSCQQYDTIVAGDYCNKIDTEYGISLAQLQSWNPGLDSTCSNLWKGYQYCVKA